MKIKKSLSSQILYFIVFGFLFYLLNRFSPFINDDYYYVYIMKDGFFGNGIYEPIKNFRDIIQSQIWAYHNHNGRFIIHTIVQAFCGIWGKHSFQIVNSLIFVFLHIGFCKAISNLRNSKLIEPISFLFILFFTPLIGITFLGNISCSVNYLWSSCAIVWYILLIQNKKWNFNGNYIRLLFVGIVSFICGALQESFSIGIVGALGLFVLLSKFKIEKTKYILILSFVLGCSILVFAPGNFVRLGQEKSCSITDFILRLIRVCLSLRAFWLFLLLIVTYYIKKREETIKFLKTNYLLIVSACINIIFCVFIAITGKHQLVCIELFFVILSLKLIYEKYYTFISNQQKVISLTLLFLISLLYIPVYYYRMQIYKSHENLMLEAKENVTGEIIAKEYEELCTSENWFVKNFCRKDNYYTYNKIGLSLYLTKGKNPNFVKNVLPETRDYIKNLCVKENLINEYIYKDQYKNFYVAKVPSVLKIEDIKIKSLIEPGFIGRYLYKFIDIKKGSKSFYISDGNRDNYFEEDGFYYIIHTNSTPVSNCEVIINKL